MPRSTCRGQAGGQVARLVGQREMAGHQHSSAGAERRRKRFELALRQLCTRARHDRQHVVWVAPGIAGAGEVLGGRGHALVLETAHRCRGQLAHGIWIVAEAAYAERRVGRLRGHVTHRRVVDVDAQRPQLAPGRAGHSLGQLLVAGRAQRHGAAKLRRLRAQPDELAALLVGGDEQRRRAGGPRCLDGRRERPDLWRVDDVVQPEQRYTGYTGLAYSPGRRRRQFAAGEGDHQTP